MKTIEINYNYINTLKKRVDYNKSERTDVIYSDFLKKVGLGSRKNLEVIAKIDDYIKEIGMVIKSYDYEKNKYYVKDIKLFTRGETITFTRKRKTKLKPQIKTTQKFMENFQTNKITNKELPINLYKHQKESITKLDDTYNLKSKIGKSGLLVLPTGAGKTATAVTWLIKNIVSNNIKILWLAHRIELLYQAESTFLKLSNKKDLPNRDMISIKKISGENDNRVINITADVDVVIASKDSLRNAFESLTTNWLQNEKELFVVVDEAHHTAAKTYRYLLDKIKSSVPKCNVLGLTATPHRTDEAESHWLKKYYPEDIIHSVNLRTLINEGILADPIFEELQTETIIDETKKLVSSINKFKDIDSITLNKIVTNINRNIKIVSTYVKNASKYGQTLIFAVNIEHAINLNKMLMLKGIKSDCIISETKFMGSKNRVDVINDFKNKKINVLINVAVLTEGTDLPNVETVFLTRPTMSTVLMTQMIGRGLRGVKAGGTKSAYIVSFVDKWSTKINWVSPKLLFISEDQSTDKIFKKRDYVNKVIGAKLLDYWNVFNSEFKNKDKYHEYSFIEKVPTGVYFFKFLDTIDGIEEEVICDVLVFSSHEMAYKNFIVDLEKIFSANKYHNIEILQPDELTKLINYVVEHYFKDTSFPNYEVSDIEDILVYYFITEEKPNFIEFTERRKLDLEEIAITLLNEDMRISEQEIYINDLWNKNLVFWEIFFGNNQLLFKFEINREVNLMLKKRTENKTSSLKKINTRPSKIKK